jgi:hypothetical protein
VTGSSTKLQQGQEVAASNGSHQTTKVTEAEIEAAADRTTRTSVSRHGYAADVTEISYRRLGQRIFAAILCLIALMLIALAVFAICTYPTAGDVHAVLGSGTSGSDALKDWDDMQAQWVNQVTQLGQYLIFGSVLPLLATVVGYLLAERQNAS